MAFVTGVWHKQIAKGWNTSSSGESHGWRVIGRRRSVGEGPARMGERVPRRSVQSKVSMARRRGR